MSKQNNDLINDNINIESIPIKKKKSSPLRASIVALLIFAFICGIIYPLVVAIIGQTAFPYQANGSVVEVTLADGTKKIFGSELIGQSYESASYMFGRVNTGAPSNISPESEEFKNLLADRIQQRKDKLSEVGYTDTQAIPDELLTSSGSGVDPHISPNTALFQVDAIIAGRESEGWRLLHKKDGSITPVLLQDGTTNQDYPLQDGETLSSYDSDFIKGIIKKYTKGRFLGIFGQKRVNVLLVNLALDGLI